MDVKNDAVFEEFDQNQPTMSATNEIAPTATEIKLPLPDEDFDKHGKLKKVRKRMLKKLVKAEIKHYLLPISFFSVFVLVLGIFFAVLLRNDLQNSTQDEYYQVNGLLILSMLMYFYAVGAFGIYAYIAPVHRYNKNFFKEEGYLTFSVPASMEEHVLAKRLTAILCSFLAGVVIWISILITCLIADGGNFLNLLSAELSGIFGDIFNTAPVDAVFLTIEATLISLIGALMMPCIFGAASCALSKYTGKKKSGITVLLVFIAVSIVESLFIATVTTDMLMLFNTPVGVHIGLWIMILLQAGLTVGAFCFEIYYLKKKLNLR